MGRLLTLLRLLVAPLSVFRGTLRPQGLVNGGDRWNSDEDFLTAILYTPALRRVDSVPDSHSEFSELSADHPESRSFLREISTGFRLTQRLHLKWNPST